jgi:hypothetical protein
MREPYAASDRLNSTLSTGLVDNKSCAVGDTRWACADPEYRPGDHAVLKAANWPLTSGNASSGRLDESSLGLSHDLESVRPRSGDFLTGAYYPQVSSSPSEGEDQMRKWCVGVVAVALAAMSGQGVALADSSAA